MKSNTMVLIHGLWLTARSWEYSHSRAHTEFKELAGRSHLIAAQEDWQEVAEYALTWAQAQPLAGAPAPRVQEHPKRVVEAFQTD